MAVRLSPALASALTRRLRPRLPWWYRFKIEIERHDARFWSRTLRPSSVSSDRCAWHGLAEDDQSVENLIEELVRGVQCDIWNATHRCWPVRDGRLGRPCTFDDLPQAEVRVRGETIDLWFDDHDGAIALPAIEAEELKR